MAFEIGDRVKSQWAGPGTITGPLAFDEDVDESTGKTKRTAVQRVKFDSAIIGEKEYPVGKLQGLDPEVGSGLVIRKTKAAIDYDAAIAEGLTAFSTNKLIPPDNPNLANPLFHWFGIELSKLPVTITIYATPANVDETAFALAGLLNISGDEALDLITVRDRKGGPKWNVDFPNFPALTLAVRDGLNVNFSHYKNGETQDVRHIRCGCTKLVQELIKTGFGSTIRKAGGDGEEA